MKKTVQAFTLVEVMAAIMILGTMVTSVLYMYSFGKSSNRLIEENMVMTNLFQYQVEELKARPFAVNVSINDDIMPPYWDYPFDVTQQAPYQGNPYLKRINVSCTYNSVMGVSQTKTMSFLVADIP